MLDLVFVNNTSLFDVVHVNPLCTPEDRHHPTLQISTPIPHKTEASSDVLTLCFNRTNLKVMSSIQTGLKYYRLTKIELFLIKLYIIFIPH